MKALSMVGGGGWGMEEGFGGMKGVGGKVPSLVRFGFLQKDSEEALREGRPVLG